MWMKNMTGGRTSGARIQELRLGDDDLLGHRRLLARDGLLPRGAGSRAQRQPARSAARRSAAAGAAAAAASAFPLQHAERDLGADASRRRGRGPDAGAAQRPAAHRARSARRPGSGAEGRARVPPEVSRDRAGALRRAPVGDLRHRAETLDAQVPNLCCSRS